MRKWHRWITVIVGLFMLFIAITGVGSQLAAIYAQGGLSEPERAAPPPPAASPPAESLSLPAPPPAATPPAPNAARKLVGLMHHLHSGEYFGPVGVIISTLTGCALIFFAISGMWMYLQMYRQRRRLGRKSAFWK